MTNDRQYNYKNITTASSPVVFSGAGILHSIVINNRNSGGTITITDTSSPSITVGTITVAASSFVYEYDAVLAGGLQVTTSASPDITVMWAKW